MQTSPAAPLTAYIKHYLFLQTGGTSLKKFRLFTDGNPGLVFCTAPFLIVSAPGNIAPQSQPAPFVYGQVTAHSDIVAPPNARITVVVFQPYGLSLLSGHPATVTTGQIIPAGDVFGAGIYTLQQLLNQQTDYANSAHLLNTYFQQLMPGMATVKHAVIQSSVQFINNQNGLVSTEQLTKYTGYSERQVERIFTESIGIGPKKFGTIVKLHRFLKLVNNPLTKNKITGVCYESGYADQSHLIKDFKKYTGITPLQYINNTHKMASNFISIQC